MGVSLPHILESGKRNQQQLIYERKYGKKKLEDKRHYDSLSLPLKKATHLSLLNFVTTSFVLFFLPVLCIGWLLRSRPAIYKYFLIAAGLFFYGNLGLEYLLLLFCVAFLNWGSAALLGKTSRDSAKKLIVAADVSIHVLILAFFKYAESFFLWLNNSLGQDSPLRHWLLESGAGDIVLPAGLSFYTFQGLSYVIDHFRNPDRKARSFADVLAYISFFPTLMAGPIMREQDFFPQLEERPNDRRAFNEGMALILSGLFKKVALATYLSEHIVDPVFRDPEGYASGAALIGIYAYSIQIFLDFSGYSDLAIGIGRLMGFRLPQNFDSPYRALNLQDFWHRWHISLSRWLRDYLYIPLGGNRRGNRYVNLTVTMVIGGIWHGNSINFLIWGFFHGIGLVIVHAFGQLKKKLCIPQESNHGRVLGILSWLLTFHFVTLLWVFFRAEDLNQAKEVLYAAVSGHVGAGISSMAILIILLGLGMQWIGPMFFRAFTGLQEKLPWPIQAGIVGLLGGVILSIGPEGVLPFIYFNF